MKITQLAEVENKQVQCLHIYKYVTTDHFII